MDRKLKAVNMKTEEITEVFIPSTQLCMWEDCITHPVAVVIMEDRKTGKEGLYCLCKTHIVLIAKNLAFD